jgi:hypothetical protein
MAFYASWKPFGGAAASVPSIALIKSSASASPFLYSQYVLQQQKQGQASSLTVQDVKNFHNDVRADAVAGAYAGGLNSQCAPLLGAVRDISQDPKVLDAIVSTNAFHSLMNLVDAPGPRIQDIPMSMRTKLLQHQTSSSTYSEDILALVPPDVADRVKILCSSCYNMVSAGAEVQEAVLRTPVAEAAVSNAVVEEIYSEDPFESEGCAGHAGDPGLLQPSHRQELLEGVVAPLAVAAAVCALMWKVTPNLAAVVFSQAMSFFGRIYKAATFKFVGAY